MSFVGGTPKRWVPRHRAYAMTLLAAALSSGCSLRELGRNIPQPEIERDYLVAVAWGAALLVSILFWPVPRQDKRPLVLVWCAKLGVTLGAMLFYEYNYGLDAYFYFAEPNQPGFLFTGFHWGNGTHNMLQLSWLQQRVIPDSYHALKVSFAMLGHVAIYVFYRALVSWLGREDLRLFYGLALFPSILFWGSILGKDPVTLLAICLYAFGIVRWHRSGRVRYLLPAALGIILAMSIRTWMGVIMLAPLSVFVLARTRSGIVKTAFLGLLGAAAVFAFSAFREQFQMDSEEDLYLTTQTLSRSWAHGGSSNELQVDFTSLTSMVTFIPVGTFTALFRPLPGEVLNPFGTFAGLENLALLAMTALAIRRTPLRELRDPLLLWAVLFVLTWGAIYGFVSYQNLGSAVRFRLQVMPFMLVLLLWFTRRRHAAPSAGFVTTDEVRA